MDTYDYDLNLLHTIDISDICNSDKRNEDYSENERKQWIANFSVNDRYILYQNFSSTIFIGSVSNQEIKRLMNTDIFFGIVSKKHIVLKKIYYLNVMEMKSQEEILFIL